MTKQLRHAGALLTHAGALLGLTLAAGPALAQAPVPSPVAPADLDRTQYRASARALGMGGTDLLMFGDVSGAAFNPAAIAFAGKGSESNTAVGRSSNVHVSKINDLSKGLKDLGNQFNNNNNTLTNVRDAFRKIYNFATDAGANDANGAPASLSASVAPLAGFSVQKVGLVAYGTVTARVMLHAYSQSNLGTNFTGLSSPSGAETAAYSVLGITNVAVPFSVPIGPAGALGISPRYVQASYAGAGFLANEATAINGLDSTGAPNGDISGATYREVNQSKFDIDAGYISPPDPVSHIRGAIVVHNLLSPSFHLPRVVNSSLGAVPAVGDFNFTEKPQIDLGLAAPYHRLHYAAEIHNLNSVNGGKHTIHLGVEYPASRFVSVRGGYDNSRFVAGLGFAFGSTHLDLATGTNPQEQVALSLSFWGK